MTPMIWFTCKKCQKKHGRADNLAGTMVFCDQCGNGNMVPWQSTTTAPETPPEPPRKPAPPPPPPAPRRPVNDRGRPADDRGRDRDWDRPPPRPRPRAPYDDYDDWDDRRRPGPPPPPDDASAGDLLRRRRAQVFRRHRPGYCFNHDDVATEKTCADCKEHFCPNCLVEVQGKTLCGPCKNFLVRGLHRPGKVPPLAIVAVIVGMVSSPVTFCLTLFGTPMGGLGAMLLGIVGLVIPVGGLVLSWLALRQIESKPNMGGRGLAMTGATSSLVGTLWCVTVVFLVIFSMVHG
ncbi:MAG TPA: hypothetical protein VMS17_07140 [Gemmataceae bacterium]|nr:hypothetical protein [Gemmataceae bacterium]